MIDDIDNIHRVVDARVGLVSVKPVSVVPIPKRNHKRVWAGVGALSVSFVLGLSIFYSVYTGKSFLYMFNEDTSMVRDNAGVSLGDIGKEPSPVDDMPYVYVAPNRMGAFGKYVVNVPYYRNWLNNTVSWKVQKSTDGLKWTDYQKFVVKKDWNSETLSEKHTVIVDADEDAFYRILTNTKADKELVSFEDKSSVTLYELSFKVSDDRSYTLLYNWSDYSKSAEASKTTLSKSIKTDSLSAKQYFEWAVTSSVKLKAGEQFVLDPVYGTIGDAVIDSWEYDTEEADVYSPNTLVRLGTSQYYLDSAYGDTGSDADGFLRVIKVFDNNGSISKTLIDKWKYDDSDGYYATVWHISGDMYAVMYYDVGASKGKIITTKVYSSNGTLRKTIDDTQNLAYALNLGSSLVHVTGDIYAAVYQEYGGGYDFQLETFEITSTGAISAACDIQEFDATPTGNAYSLSAIMIDSDTIAIVWEETVTYDYFLATYNISDAGIITNTAADTWEFYTSGSTSADKGYLRIHKISGDIFVMFYTDTVQDGWIATVTIVGSGKITKSFIDTLEIADSDTLYGSNNFFTVADASVIDGGAGVYGIGIKSGTNGDINTFNITSAGDIAAAINDELRIATSVRSEGFSCIHGNNNYYIVLHSDTDSDGWVRTFEIETYEAPAGGWSNVCPIAKGEHPTNSSSGVVLKPAVGCTITDSNSNHTMNVTFATNSSGTWRNFQTNRTVANNSKVNWTMSMAGTGNAGYSWRVYVHDGICNASFTYKFKTVSNASAESWNIVSDTINGAFTNTTVWHVKDSSINGAFTNTTVWKVKDSSINGKFTNTSIPLSWKVVDNTINGVFTNTTVWKVLDSAINGVFINTSTWHVVNNTVNGSFTNTSIPLTWKIVDDTVNGNFKNTTVWKALDSAINGKFTNTSQWHILDSTINGVFTNTTGWHIVNNTINGSFFNDTANWNILDDLIDGKFVNSSQWHVVDGMINGEFTNTSITWQIISNTINGRFINYTGNATGNGSSIRYGYSIGTVTGIMVMCGSLMVIIPLFLFKRKRRDRY